MIFYGFSKINLLILIPLEKHGDAQTHKLANIDFSYNGHRLLQLNTKFLSLLSIYRQQSQSRDTEINVQNTSVCLHVQYQDEF